MNLRSFVLKLGYEIDTAVLLKLTLQPYSSSSYYASFNTGVLVQHYVSFQPDEAADEYDHTTRRKVYRAALAIHIKDYIVHISAARLHLRVIVYRILPGCCFNNKAWGPQATANDRETVIEV